MVSPLQIGFILNRRAILMRLAERFYPFLAVKVVSCEQ
jgi:hypothetical protein